MNTRSRPKDAPYASDYPSGAEFIDLTRVWHMLISQLWIVIVCMLLAALAAAAYLWRAPRIYAARVVLQIEQEQRKVISFEDVNQDDLKPTEALKTLEQILTNRSLLQRVIEVNHLAEKPAFWHTESLAFWRANDAKAAAAPPMGDLIDILSGRISVSLRRGTRLIDIAVEDSDPRLAQTLANSLANEFISQDIDEHAGASKLAYKLLSAQAKELKEKLEQSDRDLQAYREKTHAVSLEESQNIIAGKLRELNSKVTDAKSKRLELESAIALVNAATPPGASRPDPEKLLRIPDVAATAEVVDLRKEINEREAELAVIEKRYLYKHPRNIWAKNQITQLKAALNQAAIKAAAVLVIAHESAVETEAALGAALAKQEEAALELDRISGPFNALLHQMQNDRALYDSISTRLKQTDVLSVVLPGMGKGDVRIVETAETPTRPVKPHKLRVLALALAAGLGLGVALAISLELFDASLRNIDEAEEALDIPALAAVPETHLRRWRRGRARGVTAVQEHDLPLVHLPNSAAAEAFRSLRTTLSLAVRDINQDGRSILFTSAVPGEGKSFCSVNYAVSLAQQGLTTLFINADLRRPRADGMLLRENKPVIGLAECLRGESLLCHSVHPTCEANLHVCPSGRRVSKASELLAGNRFASLLQEALQVFDRVVIDSPPIQAVSDPLLIVRHVSAVCLVVRAEKTPRRVVQRACHTLARSKIEPVGFVFNRMSTGSGKRYANYYYGKEYADALIETS